MMKMNGRCVSALAVVLVCCCGTAFGQAKKKAEAAKPVPSTITVLQPARDMELAAQVPVRVRIVTPATGKAPSRICAGLGGPPWVDLKKDEGTGEWFGTIDSAAVPNGPETLLVYTDVGNARAEMPVKVKNPWKVFFGDLHAHTSYSDGALVPKTAFDHARNTAKLDVFCLTDHLEKVDETEWQDLRQQAWKANDDGTFVTIPALEWTKGVGHANIFDPKTRQWPTDLAGFYREIAKAEVVVKFNHPGNGEKVFNGLAYDPQADRAVQMIEVRTPDEEKAYICALQQGWHVAPDGSDDTHQPNWGERRAWTGILAPKLTQRNVWDAMKRRHVYSTLDRNCRLGFEVNGAVMGDIVEKPAQTVNVIVTVDDPDPNDNTTRIELFEDGVVVQTDEPDAVNRQWRTTCTPPPGKHFYFAKVTQADGNMLWSAPVWVTLAGK